ncbi:MAG: glucosaminidase domain-containing protein [Thermomicrobiales bacterium]
MTGIPIRGTAKGSAGAAFTIAKRRGAQRLDFTRDYFVSLYAVCKTLGINADVMVAQWSEETGDGTSTYWTRDGNPAGIAAFDDGSNWGLTFTPEKAAGAQAVHMCRYLGMAVSAEMQKLDARWQAVADAGYVGKVKTTADLGNGLWATNPQYADNLISRYVAYWGEYTDAITVPSPQPPKETPVATTTPTKTYSTIVPGLPGGALVTDYPVTLNIIPKGNTYQRPGISAETPRRSVQHGTANPNSMAAGEIRWLVGGADGGQTSFHSCADDTGVWVAVPADEVTWQAADGGGPGNMNGFSCEMIENADMWTTPSRRARAIAITADFMGRVAARLKIAIPEQHWTFNWALPDYLRHDCPNKLRYVAGAWDSYVKQWSAAKSSETARMAGGAVVTPVPDVPVVTYTNPLPIKALLGTDVTKGDTAPGIVSSDGTDFVFVSDVVEVVTQTRRLQYADATSKSTGADLKKGERFIAAWLLKASDGKFYYVTPAPYWTRVLASDTKRVADAPLALADSASASIAA